MGLSVGDIVFARGGKPAVVVGYDDKTDKANLDDNILLAQEQGHNGVRNGFDSDSRAAYNSVIDGVRNPNKHKEIDDLYKRINELRSAGADPRLLRYLQGELQFRMSREQYQPVQVTVPDYTIGL